MSELSTESLRHQLDRYADGALGIEALEEWIASESWDMRRRVSRGLQRLVEAIQSEFIQYADGKITTDQLRKHLLDRREQLHLAAHAPNYILAVTGRKEIR